MKIGVPALSRHSFFVWLFQKKRIWRVYYAGIVVISNRGCITCNRKFADFMAQQNENSNLIYIITASSSAIDISPFINMNSKFVFFDERNKIGKLSLLEGSGFIFLGDQQIDTVIEIKANQIESRFDFISNRLTKAVK